jgi:hypothetical protein
MSCCDICSQIERNDLILTIITPIIKICGDCIKNYMEEQGITVEDLINIFNNRPIKKYK